MPRPGDPAPRASAPRQGPSPAAPAAKREALRMVRPGIPGLVAQAAARAVAGAPPAPQARLFGRIGAGGLMATMRPMGYEADRFPHGIRWRIGRLKALIRFTPAENHPCCPSAPTAPPWTSRPSASGTRPPGQPVPAWTATGISPWRWI